MVPCQKKKRRKDSINKTCLNKLLEDTCTHAFSHWGCKDPEEAPSAEKVWPWKKSSVILFPVSQNFVLSLCFPCLEPLCFMSSNKKRVPEKCALSQNSSLLKLLFKNQVRDKTHAGRSEWAFKLFQGNQTIWILLDRDQRSGVELTWTNSSWIAIFFYW